MPEVLAQGCSYPPHPTFVRLEVLPGEGGSYHYMVQEAPFHLEAWAIPRPRCAVSDVTSERW